MNARNPIKNNSSKTPAVEKPTTSEQLVRLAKAMFRLGRTQTDELFAVPRRGSNVAHMLKGSSDALRARLAKEYRQRTGRTPGSSALADAFNVLAGEALDTRPEPVHLRLAKHGESIVIDLGNVSGQAVIVRSSGWRVVSRSPVLFRRTALTGEMPIPVRGGSLDQLRGLLNVADDSWRLILGWFLAALLPDIPHPVLLLSGLQGTGKSCAARTLVSLIDPSAAPLRSEPRDLEQWHVAAAGSWVVAIDNLSSIPPWFSDAICKASTGDGLVKRKLYSDGDLAVLAFRRVVLLTSIDPGSLRGDLGDRLLMVDLESIPPELRRTEQGMDRLFVELRPQIFGALLDALATVLKRLPTIQPGCLPRMADFARVLAAADAAGVTVGALDCFRAQEGRITAEVVEADPFGAAVLEFVRGRGEWHGTATDLLAALCPNEKIPHGWPRANSVRGRLKRLAPALKAQGVIQSFERDSATRHRQRLINLKLEFLREQSSASSERPSAVEPFSDGSDDSDSKFPLHSNSVAGPYGERF